MEDGGNGGVDQRPPKHKGKHDKPKPWDDDPNIDRWKIEKFDPAWNETGMLEVTSFSTLFPQYREKYLQEAWPVVKSALKEYGITCELNLVEGSMTVSTTRKTKDPYIIVKARDLIKLLSRSVPAPQAIKVLNDEMQCDIIKISSFVRNKFGTKAGLLEAALSFPQILAFGFNCQLHEESVPRPLPYSLGRVQERFIKRRQRLLGPNSSTLKALEILTGCYILVQGNTVAAMGSFKALKQVRKIVEDCMTNHLHPVFHIKILMVRKELEKDPALAHESWDRFLPQFKKKNVPQKKPKKSKEKRPYTPFPPPPQPSKVDIQLETGEYFLNDTVKSEKKWREKQDRQNEKAAENKRKREDAFIPPKEPAPQETKADDGGKDDLAAVTVSLKKKAKDYGNKKLAENVNPEAFIAESGEPSKKKSKRKHS